MFHNILLVVHNVTSLKAGGSIALMMYNNVLQVFHDVLQCLVSRAMISIATSATAQMPIVSGIATTPQG